MSERLTAQCPHCQSVFHLSNIQLETAGGKVRCGNCLEPFLIDSCPPTNEQAETDELLLLEIEPGSLADTDWASGIIINPLEAQSRRTGAQAGKLVTAAILLLLLIPIQLLWFNSCSFYRHADLHNWVKWLPPPLGCNAAQQIDRSYLSLHHTKVASRLNTTDSLGIDTILSNRGNYSIRYPGLRLAFFSNRGSTVAQRVFCPEHYLSGEAFGQTELPRGSDVHLTFSIIDPGLIANRCQLSILEKPCSNQ